MNGNDPRQHAGICCLVREAESNAWDEIKDRKQKIQPDKGDLFSYREFSPEHALLNSS